MEERVAVMTGGASLIGLAFAQRWVGGGGRIVLGDQNEAAAAEIAGIVGNDGRYVSGEVRDDEYLSGLVATAVSTFGRLDAVVSGPAIFDDDGYASSRELWLRALDVNTVAAARLTAMALPHLESGAAVTYIASISAGAAQPGRMVYNVTKAGLVMLAKAGAQELAHRGIRVNTVSPGWTWSRNLAARYGSRREADAFAAEFQPLGRMAHPHEVADAIVFLSSPEASFITGTDLKVDGGYAALGPEALGQAQRKHPGRPAADVVTPDE